MRFLIQSILIITVYSLFINAQKVEKQKQSNCDLKAPCAEGYICSRYHQDSVGVCELGAITQQCADGEEFYKVAKIKPCTKLIPNEWFKWEDSIWNSAARKAACYCKPGYVLHENRCISKGDCLRLLPV